MSKSKVDKKYFDQSDVFLSFEAVAHKTLKLGKLSKKLFNFEETNHSDDASYFVLHRIEPAEEVCKEREHIDGKLASKVVPTNLFHSPQFVPIYGLRSHTTN